MHRFFCAPVDIQSNEIVIKDKEQVHYIRDVLRIKTRDAVSVFDDKGNEYDCIVKEISKKQILLGIKKRQPRLHKNKKVKLTMACAIPKKSKMDNIIDSLTQLGVDKIIPLRTERVVVKLDKQKEQSRLARWKRIAISAAQQSHRDNIPIIEPIRDISALLSECGQYGLKLIPTLMGKQEPLRQVISKSRPENILVLIGPEGDFTEEELKLAKEAGFIGISLGDSTLRVETAAVCVASFIKLYENG